MMPASHSNFFEKGHFWPFFGVKQTPVGDFRHPIVLLVGKAAEWHGHSGFADYFQLVLA